MGLQWAVLGWADVKVVGNLSNSEVDSLPLNRVARFALPSVTFLRATWHIGGVGRELATSSEAEAPEGQKDAERSESD